jgi:hypothetical protein
MQSSMDEYLSRYPDKEVNVKVMLDDPSYDRDI